MLRIVPTQSAGQAKNYYTRSDYYTEDQELPGLWRGAGAARLGLNGRVERADFERLCENRNPSTGERLTARTNGFRTVGYDFNFHAPKSLTLLHALNDDPALLKAFQDSVDETMQLVEADMRARVRKDGKQEDRTTGNMVWARFDHFTARPVDGVPDPHLHSHCFAFNVTHDGVEGQWKAGQFRNLKRDAPYYQAAFHSSLTGRLHALGLPIVQTREGWEVAGFERSTLEKFSRRTREIEALARERGIASPEEKGGLGAKTRERKANDLSMSDLRRLWRERLEAGEVPEVRHRAQPEKADKAQSLQQALRFSCDHLFERNSVVAERGLLGAMLKAGLGRFSLADARAAIHQSGLIRREVDGEWLVTSEAVLAEEQRLVSFARAGRGQCDPLAPGHALARDWLHDGQKAAVNHLLTTRDRVMMVRGAAGTGKTSLMSEAVEAIEKNGRKVFTFAPSAAASRGVLRQEGFASAETVARLLMDAKLQEQTKGQVLWIDEAGLLGARAMARVFDVAERNDCRVILSGDRTQHGSVERGAVLRILERQAGLVLAEVQEIQRQKGEYKEAIQLLSRGRTGAGFDKLDALGWVLEVEEGERYRQLAQAYVRSLEAGQSALVVSPTHAEGKRVTDQIRHSLREHGELAAEDKELPVLVRVDLTEAQRKQAEWYREGDVLQYVQNAKGHKIGDRITVGDFAEIPLEQAPRFQVYRPQTIALAEGERIRITQGGKTRDGHRLENGQNFTVQKLGKEGITLQNGWVIGREFQHLAYGYVATSHASQGKTVDHVIVGQSSASLGATSREQFYVSCSRGRKQVSVFTDDKEMLRDAVQHSDPRLAATDLIRPDPERERREHHRRLSRSQPQVPSKPRVRDRELRHPGVHYE